MKTGKNNPELLSMMWHHGHNGTIVNGVPRIGFMKGGESAKWSDIDMADYFLNKAKEYIEKKKEEPTGGCTWRISRKFTVAFREHLGSGVDEE